VGGGAAKRGGGKNPENSGLLRETLSTRSKRGGGEVGEGVTKGTGTGKKGG